MASSGIAEHHEARRREAVYLRKAFYQKQQSEKAANLPPGEDRSPTSYDQQVHSQSRQGAIPGNHGAAAVDRQRRADHYRDTQSNYSAKINNRYSSIDYISQW